jgi:hypothetical protein
VRPKLGLNAGEYAGYIIVSYSDGYTAVGAVSMAVGKAPGAEAPKPEAAANGITPTSITVKPATALSNGQSVERAIGESADAAGLSQWQAGTGFTGLESGKVYYVHARSVENANYLAGAARPSDPIPTIALSKDITPVKIDVVYGYGPGEGEEAVTISNTGEVAATVKSVTLTDITPGIVSPLFELSGDLTPSIEAGESAEFTVRPNIGHDAGDYSALITAEYDGGYTAVNIVAMTVAKKEGAGVGAPTASGTPTLNSITINAVTAPANGQQTVEYAISKNADGTQMSAWQDGLTFGGLEPGTGYYVYARSAESKNYSAGAASRSAAAIATTKPSLSLSPSPVVISVVYNYTPAATTVAIGNSGDGPATVSSIALGASSPFTLPGITPPLNLNVPLGANAASFTVQPRSGLAAGSYSDLVTVTYNGGLTVAAYVNMTVNKAPGADVGRPTVSGVPTTTSITVNAVTVSANNQQGVEYAISTAQDGTNLSAWQASPTFTGLIYHSDYYVYARSRESDNSLAGEASVSGAIMTASSGGSGTEADPYQIWNETDLRAVGKGGIAPYNTGSYVSWTLDKYYKLMVNIALKGGDWVRIGSNSEPFDGSFDGNNKSIRGLIWMLFESIGAGGMVKALTLVDGAIAQTNNGIIQSCSVSGTLSRAGIAETNNGIIQSCSVSGTSSRSGIAGTNSGIIQSCSVSGTINSISETGGIASSNGGTIQNCYFSGTLVVGNFCTCGGVTTLNYGTVQNCYVTGNSISSASSKGVAPLARCKTVVP